MKRLSAISVFKSFLIGIFVFTQVYADNSPNTSSAARVRNPRISSSQISPVFAKLDSEALILRKIGTENILAKGSLAQMGNKMVVVGKNKTMSLSSVVQKTFIEQDTLQNELRSVGVSSQALIQPPEMTSEVFEFQNSFVVVKSTSFVVSKPQQLAQNSNIFKKYKGKRKGSQPVNVASLDREKLKGFRSFMQNELRQLPDNDPLKVAAAQGEDAVLQAVAEGKGKYEVIDTLFVPKAVLPEVNGRVQLPFPTKHLQSMDSENLDQGVEERVVVEKPSMHESGKATFHTEFMSGFTKGNSWEWERRWNFPSGFFRITLGASYGLGLRIPIDLKGEVSPTEILTKDVEDKPRNVNTKMEVDTLDAGADFYRRVGLPQSKIFEGKEAVFEAKFGYGYKLRALWDDLLHHPFSYIGIDESQHFKPPMGRGHDGPIIPIPAEATQTKFEGGILNGFAQIGIRITGKGTVLLDFQPFLGAKELKKEEIKFPNTSSQTQENERPNANSQTKKSELPAISGNGDKLEKPFGFTLGNPRYKIDLTLVPVVRLEATVGVDWLSRHFSTGWIDLNALSVDIGSVSFSRHSGTRKNYKFSQGKKKFEKIGSNYAENIKDGDIVGIQSVPSGKFVRGGLPNAVECGLGATSPHCHLWEAFKFHDLGGGKVALQLIKNAQYIRAGLGEKKFLAAISPHKQSWETFKMVKLGDGKVTFQAINSGKYVRVNSAEGDRLTSDSARAGASETFRFWPAWEVVNELPVTAKKDIVGIECVKNGKYIRAGMDEKSRLAAVSPHLQVWEAFRVKDLGDRKIALQSVKSNKYVSISYNIPRMDVMALSSDIGPEETFKKVDLRDHGKVALHSGVLGKYIRAGMGQNCFLGAGSTSPGEWEEFRFHRVPQTETTARSQWQSQPRRENAQEETDEESRIQDQPEESASEENASQDASENKEQAPSRAQSANDNASSENSAGNNPIDWNSISQGISGLTPNRGNTQASDEDSDSTSGQTSNPSLKPPKKPGISSGNKPSTGNNFPDINPNWKPSPSTGRKPGSSKPPIVLKPGKVNTKPNVSYPVTKKPATTKPPITLKPSKTLNNKNMNWGNFKSNKATGSSSQMNQTRLSSKKSAATQGSNFTLLNARSSNSQS